MKTLIALFTAFTIHQAHADTNLTDDLSASCSNVTKLGVLAKDNMPYWANPADDGMDVEACYQAVINVIELNHINKNLRASITGPIQILNTDEEFASFIEANQTMDADFIMEVPQNDSLLPVTRPPSPAFFTN